MKNQTWRKWIRRLGVVLILAGVFIGLLYAFQERIIFHPQTLSETEAERMADEHDHVEQVSFQGENGDQLHGWFLHPADRKSEETNLLIYYGGNAEELSAQIPEMAVHLEDWSVLLVNYRGYGMSDGSPGQDELYSDALMIYDKITNYFNGDIASIVLMGRSLGTAVAIEAAAERYADGLILVSPFDTLTDVARNHYPFLPVSWLLRHSFDASSRVDDVSLPLLTIVAEEDRIIPEERTKALLEVWQDSYQYEVMEGRGHNDLQLDERFWMSIQEFLELKK